MKSVRIAVVVFISVFCGDWGGLVGLAIFWAILWAFLSFIILLRRFIVMVNLRAMICVDPALANPVLTISKRSFRITSSSQCIHFQVGS